MLGTLGGMSWRPQLLSTDSSSTIWLHGGNALFYLQSKPFHQPTPLLLFLVDIGGIGLGCAGQCFGAFGGEPALHIVGRERSVELLVESRNDRKWRAGRRNQSVAQRDVEAGHAAFSKRRDIGQEARTFRTGNRYPAQRACLDVAECDRNRHEHHR